MYQIGCVSSEASELGSSLGFRIVDLRHGQPGERLDQTRLIFQSGLIPHADLQSLPNSLIPNEKTKFSSGQLDVKVREYASRYRS